MDKSENRVIAIEQMRKELYPHLDNYEQGLVERALTEAKGNGRADAEARIEELQALFDLQHTRTVEADHLWRKAHPGNDLISPDLGKLIEWLTERAALADPEQVKRG